ncbi:MULTISPECIES: YhcB family protein [unclassified Thioalkalivibrio]|uniref:YhcB family protein n=1 Tax=unclassified Thioalkalivibrio TaxID=2621013 RepID=UPI00037D64A5|nr:MULTISPECIES: YhcB family protein [unclassified Thioalkalivibrio]
MEDQTAVGLWTALGILAIVVAGLVGFWVGRVTSDERKLIRELEEELDRRMQELTRYRGQVNDHFDRTATLFATMAGSYRDLYHHLAQSAGELADKPTRDRLEDRAGRLLSNVPNRDYGDGEGRDHRERDSEPEGEGPDRRYESDYRESSDTDSRASRPRDD